MGGHFSFVVRFGNVQAVRTDNNDPNMFYVDVDADENYFEIKVNKESVIVKIDEDQIATVSPFTKKHEWIA